MPEVMQQVRTQPVLELKSPASLSPEAWLPLLTSQCQFTAQRPTSGCFQVLRPNLAQVENQLQVLLWSFKPLIPTEYNLLPAMSSQLTFCHLQLSHSATKGSSLEQVMPLYHFLCTTPLFLCFCLQTASTCCSFWRTAQGLLEPSLPHTQRHDISGNFHPPLGTHKSLTACGNMEKFSHSGWLGKCRYVTIPPGPPAGCTRNHILVWLSPGIIILPPSLFHWPPRKQIFNKSLAHSLHFRVCSGHPDLLTFEQSEASCKAEFSILYGQGRKNI